CMPQAASDRYPSLGSGRRLVENPARGLAHCVFPAIARRSVTTPSQEYLLPAMVSAIVPARGGRCSGSAAGLRAQFGSHASTFPPGGPRAGTKHDGFVRSGIAVAEYLIYTRIAA